MLVRTGEKAGMIRGLAGLEWVYCAVQCNRQHGDLRTPHEPRRILRAVLALVVKYHPDRALANLR